MVFFWAAEVTETKATVVQVPAGFVLNVSNAATSAFPADGAVSLGIETVQMDATPWKGAVAHLGKAAGACQVKLDLVFGAEQKVKFYLAKGQGKVHLTGYFQPGPPSDLFEEDIPVVVEHAEPAKKSKKRARDEPKATTVAWDQVRGRLHVMHVCMCVRSPICKFPPRSRFFIAGGQTIWDSEGRTLRREFFSPLAHAWSLRLSPRSGRQASRPATGEASVKRAALLLGEGPSRPVGALLAGNAAPAIAAVKGSRGLSHRNHTSHNCATSRPLHVHLHIR